MFEGEHDFVAFRSSGSNAKTTVRTIYSSRVTGAPDGAEFTITGNGFLYNMVRIMAGALVRVGKGETDAESVLRAGGEVTGVEPQLFIDKGYEYDEITTLIVTRDMTERKTKMIELGDAFIAFPGGTGTLEEISEIMSKVSLKQLAAPCILYNLNGYYDHLKALLAHMIDMGLSTPERQEGIYFAEMLDDIRAILKI